MNFTQLQYFCIVATYQNVTKAAKALYISQPSLTKTIKSLEKELGAPLFSKKGRCIELTEAGRVFYNRVNEGLNIIDKGIDEFRSCYFNCNNLSIFICTAPKYAGNLVSDFIKENPDINVQCSNIIYQGNVSNKNYDVIICSKKDIPKGYKSIKILEEEMLLLIPKSYTKLKEKTFEFTDLKDYPFISDWDSSELRRYIMQFFSEKNIIPNIKYNADSIETYVSMIKAELGIAFVPKITFYKMYEKELANHVSLAKVKDNFYKKELYIAYKDFENNTNISTFCKYASNYY